jgi:hypothetical protein
MIEMHDQSSLLADITYLILMRLAPDAFVTANENVGLGIGFAARRRSTALESCCPRSVEGTTRTRLLKCSASTMRSGMRPTSAARQGSSQADCTPPRV